MASDNKPLFRLDNSTTPYDNVVGYRPKKRGRIGLSMAVPKIGFSPFERPDRGGDPMCRGSATIGARATRVADLMRRDYRVN